MHSGLFAYLLHSNNKILSSQMTTTEEIPKSCSFCLCVKAALLHFTFENVLLHDHTHVPLTTWLYGLTSIADWLKTIFSLATFPFPCNTDVHFCVLLAFSLCMCKENISLFFFSKLKNKSVQKLKESSLDAALLSCSYLHCLVNV